MRRATVIIFSLLLCVGCAARHQIPATERQLQGTVTTAEESYKQIYSEYKANRFGPMTQATMGKVDELYNAWRSTNGMLIDAVRSGAISMAPDK